MMIRINLLPTKRKKAKPVPTFIITAVFLLLAALIVGFYGVSFMNAKIEDLENQKQANAQKISELNEKIKEVKDFEKHNNTYEERKKIIEQLSMSQSLPAKLLDEMSMTLTDGIWLNSMDIAGNRIILSGNGFTTSDIVAYVTSLKNSSYLTDVVLDETRAAVADGADTFSFRITMGLKT